MPSLYRRMSSWFNRRSSGSTKSEGSASSTPSASPTAVKSSSSLPSSVGNVSSHATTSSCVLTRTAPSAYDNNTWSNATDSVLLNEPVDMTYTPHPSSKQYAAAGKSKSMIMVSQPIATTSSPPTASTSAIAQLPPSSAPISSIPADNSKNVSLTRSAPARTRRISRPRHFTFSEAHVSRSQSGRLARTTAFF